MQSWGYRSRFKNRDTSLEPTKSGVVGLLCCALGRDRHESPSDLAELKMHVRVDRPGRLLTDFHTAGGGTFRGRTDYFAPTSSGNKGKNPVITERQYLSDASFVVALEGPESVLNELAERLIDPVWPLSLGRKSCPPTEQVFIGLVPESAKKALDSAASSLCRAEKPRFIWELDHAGPNAETRNDVPVSWTDRMDRVYTVRFVESKVGEWKA
jgi:CRISPR system Cascade subunit CasD